MSVELDHPSERALASLDGEVGRVLFRGDIVIAIHPDAVVGMASLHLRFHGGTDSLQGIGLRGLGGELKGTGEQEQRRESSNGRSESSTHKGLGCTEVREVCVAGPES